MKTKKRNVKLGWDGLFVLLLIILVVGCQEVDRFAKMEVVKEVSLQNGEMKAIMYILDYGATASSRLNVSILPRRARIISGKGVVYSALFVDHLECDLIKIDDVTIKILHEYRPQEPSVSCEYFEGIRIFN